MIERTENSEIKYYWACQGQSYEEEKKLGILKAPAENTYKRLKELKTNDIVINYSNEEIKSISIVKQNTIEKDEMFISKVEYKELEHPISLKKLRELFNEIYQNIEKGPFQKTSDFNKSLKCKQKGYIFYFSKEWFDMIFSDLDKSIIYNALNYNKKNETKKEEREKSIIQPKNQILYGPPGTGKTYNTVIEAMKIIEPKNFDDKGNLIGTYKDLKTKFDEYKKQGRIEFVTFHQSYSYEEFVEGIKPVLDADNIKYEKKEGVFKNISQNALFEMLDISKDSEKSAFVFNELLEKFKSQYPVGSLIKSEKSHFTIADYSSSSIRINPSTSDRRYSISFEPLEDMFKNHLVEPYSMPKNLADRYGAFEGLSSYYYNVLIELKNIYDTEKGNILIKDDTSTNYSKEQKNEFIKKYLKKEISLKKKKEPHVLIIDEINRGNISKIFGELITLIEEDKRLGEDNEVTVKLPYAEEAEPAFGVPSNLYIIGTMNTSDRSIASVDIALRRRFKFKEIMPQSNLVADFGCNFKEVFELLNKRIAILLDRDHQIGHSYFIEDKYKNAGVKELKEIWFDSIIPLLNEYFYGDWEKLQKLLGCAKDDKKTSFIKKLDKIKFADDTTLDDEENCYDFVDKEEIDFVKAMEHAFKDVFKIEEQND